MEEEPESARTCEKISGERVDGSLITHAQKNPFPLYQEAFEYLCRRAAELMAPHLQDCIAGAAPALVSGLTVFLFLRLLSF